jgi:hypothetical protein
VELSHQLNGELHVWLGEQDIYQCALPLEYSVGLAPGRPARSNQPSERKTTAPRIYTLGGRAAVAWR